MAEIKLRAWNKESKRMGRPSTLNSLLMGERNNGVAEGRVGIKQTPCDEAEKYWGHIIWMLSSGRKDKKDEEIFDGDKVSIEMSENKYTTYEVLYDGGSWLLTGSDDDWTDDLLSNYEDNELEVVGHIYEA